MKRAQRKDRTLQWRLLGRNFKRRIGILSSKVGIDPNAVDTKSGIIPDCFVIKR